MGYFALFAKGSHSFKENFMKKLSKILIFALAIVTAFSFAACTEDDGVDETLTGWAIEYKLATAENADGENKEYVSVEGLFVADGTALAVSDTTVPFDYIDLKIGALNAAGKPVITVPVLDDDGNKVYDNKVLKTEELDLSAYDHVEISGDAFANQLIIGSVEVGSVVTKIGSSAFSGCANLTEMTLPFVGGERVGVNAAKTLGYLFGTSEADGCTSVTMNYNSTGTGTYYIPSGLTKVTVNGAKDESGNAYELPRYAFNAITSLKNVVLNGDVSVIGESAFSGCTSLIKFDVPASVTAIGAKAFYGCTALLDVDFANATALKDIYQEAFSGCTSLGSGLISDRTIDFPASLSHVYEKAFYGCTSLTSVNFKACSALTLDAYSFYGCSSLKTASLNASAKVGDYAFENCADGFKKA